MSFFIQRIKSIIAQIDTQASIASIYHYGSCVYDTQTVQSDIDYICIVNSTQNKFNGEQVSFYADGAKQDVQFMTVDHFQSMLNEHKIWALECLFLPSAHIVYQSDIQWSFQLDLEKLRSSVSSVASNAWIKCKKKIEVENTPYVGLKSLFHSLRVLYFGIQIAKLSKIANYKEANLHYAEIMSVLNTDQCQWSYLKDKYQGVYNQLSSEFRLVAPKCASVKTCIRINK